MSFLLDTNVVSEIRKRRGIADDRVRRWAETQSEDVSYISVVTIMEIELGIGLRARRDPETARVLRAWLDGELLPAYGGRLLGVTLPIAKQAAHLHIPDPMEERDGLIAATALVHGLTLVTRDTKHFERTDVPLINPWEF